MPQIRVTEVLAALSLTTDLASGVPFEKGLATCAVSTAFAEVLGLPADERQAVFHAALLRAVGCTAYAPENAALFVDDTAFQSALKVLDPGDPDVFSAQTARFGEWAGPTRQGALSRRFLDVVATEAVRATAAGCEVSRALGPRLGLPPSAVEALDQAVARWNAGDLDGYLGLYDPTVRLHGYSPEPMDRGEVSAFYQGIFAAFPGCRLTVHETFGDGARIGCRFTLSGRHEGPFLGVPATGRDVVLPGITVLHFRDGRCVERWSCADMLGLLVQIGAVAPPA